MTTRLRVLIVDDHPFVLAALANVLRPSHAWELVLAQGMANARACLDERRGGFDVIVSDIHMPGGDGEALLREVMTTYPLIRRIALTGDAGSEKAARVKHICHRFVEKPCAPADLQAAIRAVVAGAP